MEQHGGSILYVGGWGGRTTLHEKMKFQSQKRNLGPDEFYNDETGNKN